jgi:hypothetical protein
MDESGTETSLPFPIEVGEDSITTYEAARNFFSLIHGGTFKDAFTRLFPTPGALLDPGNLWKFSSFKNLCAEFKKMYQISDIGSFICVALLLETDSNATSIQMSRVCFPSIEALITKSESSGSNRTQEQDPDSATDKMSFLLDGFNQSYIDPHSYVQHIADQILDNMLEYTMNSGNYIAPYTSLVTSSMMGKSRLLKELTKYLPIVSICLREDNSVTGRPSTGFPLANRELREWFGSGVCGSLGNDLNSADMKADRDNLIPTLKHSFFLLHLFENLDALINKLFGEGKDLDRHTQNVKHELESSEKLSRKNFEWMWEYFCNHREPFLAARTAFWKKVQSQTDDRLNQVRNPGPLNEPDNESTAELDGGGGKNSRGNLKRQRPSPAVSPRSASLTLTPEHKFE